MGSAIRQMSMVALKGVRNCRRRGEGGEVGGGKRVGYGLGAWQWVCERAAVSWGGGRCS